ncbi:hypothetical protein ACNKHU_01780 [Shigella flexneri]
MPDATLTRLVVPQPVLDGSARIRRLRASGGCALVPDGLRLSGLNRA